ncbi:TPA: ATP-dependent endonuclease, partial [Enterococcus faecium]
AMLKLANHVGKGWFAIELGEKIDFLIKIPKYILNAIAFACQEIVDLSIYKKILLHTIDLYEETTELSALSASLKTSDTADLNIAIISLLEYFGKDEDVVYLINQIENYTKILYAEVSK